MSLGFVRDEEVPGEDETPEVRHGETHEVPPTPVVTFTADQVIALLAAALKSSEQD